jgi:dTDP-4-amino-4,6-dideoxygalactose transaminase
MKPIKYNQQFLDNNDKKSVMKALNQNLITGGDSVINFENKLKKFLKVKYAVTCSNGTSGLHLAFEAINLKKDDIIIMPIINFVAAYSMANLYLAKIFFADVDSSTGQMTPKSLEDCIKKNKIKNIKAIVLMYMGGFPENVLNFYKLKRKYQFHIIEDSCHSFGSSYKFRNNYLKIGSCKHSDICVFSFHPVKTITTGEGGLLCTNNKKIYNIAKQVRSHNVLRNKNYWDYDIKKTSFNYRLSDINCALGISQLKKIYYFLSDRKKSFKEYLKLMKINNFINFPVYSKNIKPSFHLAIININFKKKKNKNKLITFLNNKKIYPQFHYKPLYKFSFAKKLKIDSKNFPGCKSYYNSSISIPLFVGMKKREIYKVCNSIKNYLNK